MTRGSQLPDEVREHIERLARRHNGRRRGKYAGGLAGYLRYARGVVTDALEEVARGALMLPPP